MNRKILYLLFILMGFIACNPEARYTTEDVEIEMSIKTVSAGFVECSFSTNKDAYYLIAIEEVRPDYDPMAHQKQFMTLALDSANVEYLAWRNKLLRSGEFNIAPFASHSLQYGAVDHFFTGLWFDTEYWVYAFVVDPETMKPAGKLYLEKIKTEWESIVSLHFEYRVKGTWDYIYPIDSASGDIHAHFPYVATTRDSLEIERDMADTTTFYSYLSTPQDYFSLWLLQMSTHPEEARVLYGVSAINNDGLSSHLVFEEGHTYYTFIGGYDFSVRQNALFKFKWEGEKTNLYFTEKDNIAWENYEQGNEAEVCVSPLR